MDKKKRNPVSVIARFANHLAETERVKHVVTWEGFLVDPGARQAIPDDGRPRRLLVTLPKEEPDGPVTKIPIDGTDGEDALQFMIHLAEAIEIAEAEARVPRPTARDAAQLHARLQEMAEDLARASAFGGADDGAAIEPGICAATIWLATEAARKPEGRTRLFSVSSRLAAVQAAEAIRCAVWDAYRAECVRQRIVVPGPLVDGVPCAPPWAPWVPAGPSPSVPSVPTVVSAAALAPIARLAEQARAGLHAAAPPVSVAEALPWAPLPEEAPPTAPENVFTSVPIGAPIPLFLTCPWCKERHIDRGAFATKPHHTHACQRCGLTWRPAIEPTVGVAFLPGFRDEPAAPAAPACARPPVPEPRLYRYVIPEHEAVIVVGDDGFFAATTAYGNWAYQLGPSQMSARAFFGRPAIDASTYADMFQGDKPLVLDREATRSRLCNAFDLSANAFDELVGGDDGSDEEYVRWLREIFVEVRAGANNQTVCDSGGISSEHFRDLLVYGPDRRLMRFCKEVLPALRDLLQAEAWDGEARAPLLVRAPTLLSKMRDELGPPDLTDAQLGLKGSS